jgi:hypothetical protein
LSATQLVVLSACDSGVGEIQNGEGVYGLRRALALAGAQTQLTSLWKIPDDATRELMVNYYRRLLQGEGPICGATRRPAPDDERCCALTSLLLGQFPRHRKLELVDTPPACGSMTPGQNEVFLSCLTFESRGLG